MQATAALITAIAALIAAIAWSTALMLILYLFKEKFALAFDRIPSVIDRMNKIKLGALEAELEKQADSAAVDIKAGENISPQQIEAAARVGVQAKSLDIQSLRDKINQLCFEYDT